jgi:dCMP deaminase
VALFPCNECAKAIIQSGVKEVLYLSDKYADSMSTMASKRMMDSAGVKYTRLVPEHESITLDFIPEENRK